MDRAEATGFGVATAGHVALFAALSLGLAVSRLPPPAAQPIEVSFVKDVGLTNSAPQPVPAPPAPSAAPEPGPPEEAAPAPPLPAPVPEPPVPAPAPPKAVEPPRPAPKPAAKPAPAKPAPQAAPAQPPTKPTPARPAPPRLAGNSGTARATHGSRLSLDMLRGLDSDPSPSQSQQAQASVMSAEALAGIQAAIARQIQPCANRQVNPGPGANQIRVKLNLRLNRDGSLARTPTVLGTTGVTAANGRYEDRVKDLAIAAYVGCAPLRGLPDELYQTPKGGWGNINMNYHLP